MKRMNRLIGSLFAALVCAAVGTAGAEDLVITSFGGNGQLVFNTLNDGTNYEYRMEWAPSPAGPWTCFEGAAGLLQSMSPAGSGSVTSSVPMCYRVVALPPYLRGMVRIPAGTNAGIDPDFGAYSLTVEEFYMDRYEVTKVLWDEVYAWSTNSHGYAYDNAGSGKASDHPVHTVNWFDCLKWCNAHSQKNGRTPIYYTDAAMMQVYTNGQVLAPYVKASANGYRLPTMTEWEYAARGGLSGKRFPWGDTITHSQANYFSASAYSYDTSPTRGNHPTYATGETPYTSPVGAFAANGYGLYDMAGNAWGWCNDTSDSYRGIRGGCWYGHATFARCGDSYWRLPTLVSYGLGFRTVCR